MRTLSEKSVDFCLTDPPYGTTRNKWDTTLDLGTMWYELKRVCVGPTVFTTCQPFTSALVMSNPDCFKYEWVWKKSKITGVLNAKKQPVRQHENVLVFSENPANYYPQGLMPLNKIIKQGGSSDNYNKRSVKPYFQEFTNYPRSVLEIKSEGKTVHPTQKPVALLEYLIKTYTLEGETVLDFTMGSGSTGVACKNLNRNFIGIEKDEKYFQIACERLGYKP